MDVLTSQSTCRYEGYDKVRNVQDEVNKVKGTMAANIDMQLANMVSRCVPSCCGAVHPRASD